MTKFLMVCTVAMTTLLGGCASTGGVPSATDVTALIAQVQGYTKIACGFVPTASTILGIVSGGNAGVIAAGSIAQAVCASISPTMMARKGATPRTVKGWKVTPGMVNGVPVQGDRVR